MKPPMEPWTVLLFATLLGCIAAFPLIGKVSHLWHKPQVKLICALLFGVPMAIYSWSQGYDTQVQHAMIEYVQFICLLGSLFVVSGGINVKGDLLASPRTIMVFLLIGWFSASLIGTTGAAMLLIRPLCKTISERQYKMHTVIFAIFIVANCGGLLTPLGDPPLFLGMLRGVPFTWTLTNLWMEWLFVNGMLMAMFYILDQHLYKHYEPNESLEADMENVEPIKIEGALSFLFLLFIVLSVAFIPTPYREIVMVASALGSYMLTNPEIRKGNGFNWEPILEVATLFIGIFLTMVPALIYLRQIAPDLPISEMTLYIFTGGLSAVLDNAPTYVTFFEISRELGGEGVMVAGVLQSFLVAISLAAVFGGALTYIGNGPNFMVKAVAESMEIKMPSFVGYMKWSFNILLPILVWVAIIFIAKERVLGGGLSILHLTFWTWRVRRKKWREG